MKKRKGISLVEVMMSFVLVGFLVLLVSGAVTSSFRTSAAMQKLPGLYYKGQQEIEDELDSLEEKVTQKYLYEKELSLSASHDASLAAELDAINAELDCDHEKIVYELFGKRVTVYQFSRECETNNVGKVKFYAGTASGVRLERPTPVIESVTINLLGESVSTNVYSASDKTVTTVVDYSETNRDYCYTELYQWYISDGDQHAVYYADGTPGPDEMQHGAVMPVYPGNFTPITSERTSTMTIKDEYRGKFIFCLATPLSINGKMGGSAMSNLIYISDLPDGLAYRAVIDPSLMTFGYSDSGIVKPSAFDSMSASDGVFTVKTGAPYVDLRGEPISEESSSASRFISFASADSIKGTSTLTPKTNDKIFAVVRSRSMVAEDFIYVGTRSYGFNNGTGITEPNESGWVIITMDAASSSSQYTVGKADVDIAELIIVNAPGSAGSDRITEYLKNKSGMN